MFLTTCKEHQSMKAPEIVICGHPCNTVSDPVLSDSTLLDVLKTFLTFAKSFGLEIRSPSFKYKPKTLLRTSMALFFPWTSVVSYKGHNPVAKVCCAGLKCATLFKKKQQSFLAHIIWATRLLKLSRMLKRFRSFEMASTTSQTLTSQKKSFLFEQFIRLDCSTWVLSKHFNWRYTAITSLFPDHPCSTDFQNLRQRFWRNSNSRSILWISLPTQCVCLSGSMTRKWKRLSTIVSFVKISHKSHACAHSWDSSERQFLRSGHGSRF